jgi:hypothetical protein
MRKILIIVLVVFLLACGSEESQVSPNKTTKFADDVPTKVEAPPEPTPPPEPEPPPVVEVEEVIEDSVPVYGDGYVVFAISDAAENMENISEVNVQIRSVMLHHARDNDWISMDFEPQSYDLLRLKRNNLNELIVESEVPAGEYDMFQLSFGDVDVLRNDEIANGKMPSKAFRSNFELVVDKQLTSFVLFDVLADKSIHQTKQGHVIFTPVMKVLTQHEAFPKFDGNQVTVINATDIFQKELGMRLDGSVSEGIGVSVGKALSYQQGKIVEQAEVAVDIERVRGNYSRYQTNTSNETSS